MSSTVVGVVLITRHGDREGYYQNPTSYTASGTLITPLGELQEYQSGMGIRQRYFNPSSADYITNISTTIPNLSQIDVRADAAEGQVIVDSALALFQGVYPASVSNNITLANGSTIISPLGGYIYVPVQTVEPEEDFTLEGFTECNSFISRNTAVYNTPAFLQVANQSSGFLNSLKSVVGGRSVSLSNMYNIFDYMNVNYIHNATFYNATSLNTMQQARALANFHEYIVFTDPSSSGIGHIAGRSILGPILTATQGFTNSSNPLKLLYLGCAYKPFLSLFNLTQTGIVDMVDYASVAAFEVRKTNNDYSVRLNFRNGTPTALDGSDIQPVQMWGQTDVPLNTFISNLSPVSINNLTQWCQVCNNTQTRGCDTVYAASLTPNLTSEVSALESGIKSLNGYASPSHTYGKQHVSPVVSGVIGALIALVLAAIVVTLMEYRRSKKFASRGIRNNHGGDSSFELRSEAAGSAAGSVKH